MIVDEAERSILAGLADVLIPASARFLSASQAGVAREGLDQVLALRPDLANDLRSLLHSARGRDPAEVIAELQSQHTASFAALGELVAGAYFMNPHVRAAIGYTGQAPRPIDHRPDYMDDGLLQSVIDRGPIYRPTLGRKRDQ